MGADSPQLAGRLPDRARVDHTSWPHRAGCIAKPTRMLGNGLCTRPAELDCHREFAREACAYIRTGAEFLPILDRRRGGLGLPGEWPRAG